VAAIEITGGELALRTGEGTDWKAHTVVLTLALEQTAALLEPLAPCSRTLASACGVLRMVGSLPCLTVLAGFSAGVPAPAWDVLYPEDSTVLHLVSHDSRKRPAGSNVVLVAQARPCWSRQNLDRPTEQWSESILRETARLVGEWVSAPRWRQAHRWKFARVDRGSELARPLLLEVSQTARIGVAGEMFAPGGGVQAAWESGRRLARRCIEEASA
jgi:predicted NAD/FAD-dependent oxidoreductase